MKKSKKSFLEGIPKYLLLGAIALGTIMIIAGKVNIEIISASSESSDSLYTLKSIPAGSQRIDMFTDESKYGILVTSGWCSSCEAIRAKIRSKPDLPANIYEVDLDQYRNDLVELDVKGAPALISIVDGQIKNINDLTLPSLDNAISNLN